MSYRPEHRLPNGTTTKDSKKYIKAWRSLAEPIEKVTGTRAMSYDPNIQFTLLPPKGVDRAWQSVHLPVWFIELLNEALNRKDK